MNRGRRTPSPPTSNCDAPHHADQLECRTKNYLLQNVLCICETDFRFPLRETNMVNLPVKAGLDYMKTPLSNEQLLAAGKTSGPFACSDIEEQTGKYGSTETKCGNARSCKYNVDLPLDGIHGEHYMTICSSSGCPPEYPWLETH